ncbi:LytTR family DNA-binding domain-containing protein [Winogradskyella maritima]|uniref:LytR/AlgR family response regulator transcription factor n=1 Tax=Winogradskyella maritima TaxID=1517766 RepID=A0ABV8AHE9_9FLAO|nr:LytTR family DNA-binding domain-containing protein [Winogradskyella maritima]
MTILKTLIVDDEVNARENLRFLLDFYCKNVEVVAEASNVDEAVEAINKLQPQLVFLDIEMPKKNGFHLFETFREPDFQVIFVTAYDTYALKAFKVSALDYLLKPINTEALKSAISKAVRQVDIKLSLKKHLDILKENTKSIERIAIPYKSDYVILNLKDVSCIEANRMYSKLYVAERTSYLASKKLSYYEDLLADQSRFVRVHRSWLINLDHVETYSKREKCLTLKYGRIVPLSKSYKLQFESVFI